MVRKIVMGIVLMALLILVCCVAIQDASKEAKIKQEVIAPDSQQNMNYILSDSQFTNENWTTEQVYRFVKSWPNNKFTDYDIDLIANTCKTYGIHPLIVFIKMEQEQNLVRNNSVAPYTKRRFRAMAYGLSIKKYINGKKIYVHGGFTKQVTRGVKLLRKAFDQWKEGMSIEIDFGEHVARPTNAATWSLYVYTPFYGTYKNYGTPCTGNSLLIHLDKLFRDRWNSIIKQV
jgi:hypothetical protein